MGLDREAEHALHAPIGWGRLLAPDGRTLGSALLHTMPTSSRCVPAWQAEWVALGVLQMRLGHPLAGMSISQPLVVPAKHPLPIHCAGRAVAAPHVRKGNAT